MDVSHSRHVFQLSHLLEHKHPLLVQNGEVEQAIPVDIGDLEGCTDSAIFVDRIPRWPLSTCAKLRALCGETYSSPCIHRRGCEGTQRQEQGLLKLIHHPLDAIPHMQYMEVEEQSDSLVREFQVGQKLGFMNRRESLHSFNLDNHRVRDQKVQAIADIDSMISIHDGQFQLPLNMQPATDQFKRQATLIRRLQQARAEGRVDMHRSINDLTTDLIEVHRLVSLRKDFGE